MADSADQTSLPTTAAEAVEYLRPEGTAPLLILCDHASNALPKEYGTLGLEAEEFKRHIAWDIGAAAVTRRLSELLDAPAILTRFSRLLIDPNRGEDDPTLIMKLSDGAIIPGNRYVDEAERAARLERFYRPYHDTIDRHLGAAMDKGEVPAILSIHSFTPDWKTARRHWDIGILWDVDPRLPEPFMAALRAEEHLVVGDNEPYSGRLKADCMYRHGTQRGIPHVLVELRQDLIELEEGQEEWAQRLARITTKVLAEQAPFQVEHFTSWSDPLEEDRITA